MTPADQMAEKLTGRDLLDDIRGRQEPASHHLPPRRDLVAELIARAKAKIDACFAGLPKMRATLKSKGQPND